MGWENPMNKVVKQDDMVGMLANKPKRGKDMEMG